MTLFRRLLAVALTVAVLVGVVKASHAPMTLHESDDAMLRLAWSARPEHIEHCRTQSDEELARLPAHMRQRVVCEGAAAHYRLTVRHAGRLVVDRLVHAGGLRQDRRLYVLEEVPIAPGEALVEVRFERVEGELAGKLPDGRPVDREARGDFVPPRLALEERVRFEARSVVLVTYDPERHELGMIPARARR